MGEVVTADVVLPTSPRRRDDRYSPVPHIPLIRDQLRWGNREGWGDRARALDRGEEPPNHRRDSVSPGRHYVGRNDSDDGGRRRGVGRHRCSESRYESPEWHDRRPRRDVEQRRSLETDGDRKIDTSDRLVRKWDRYTSSEARSLPAHIRLGNFSGDKCLETFLAKFENMSAYLNWSERDRLFHLKASLEGPAGQVLWDMGSQSSVSDIIRLLRARFGTDNQAERFRAELRARRRRKGEGLQSLYNDICRLVALAFPGSTNPTVQVVGRDAFLDALDDYQLRIRVLEREPQTLEAALSIASKLEAYRKSADASTLAEGADTTARRATSVCDDLLDTDDRKTGRGKRQVRGVSAKPASENSLPGADVWQAMMSQLAELKTAIETDRSSWDCKFKQLKETMASNSHSSATLTGGAGRTDDTLKDCCYFCKAPGHFKRDCPNRNQTGSARAADADRARVHGVSGPTRGGEVYLTVTLSGRTISALLDTGCERSIIGRSLISNAPLEPTEAELLAVNGTVIPLLGRVTLDMYLNEYPIKADMVVTDVFDDLILGIDWLGQNGGVWDFTEAELHLSGRTFPVRSRPGRPAVSHLVVTQDLRLPARAVTEVPVKVVRSHLAEPAISVRSPESVGQQSRWLDWIAEYNPKIEHRSDVAHSNADALSRRPCESEFGGGCSQCDKWARPAVVRRMETRSRTRRRKSKEMAVMNGEVSNSSDARAAVGGEQTSPKPTDANVLFADGQASDPDLAKLIQWKTESVVRPAWSAVAAESDELRTLYAQWDSLTVVNNVLYRKYVAADGAVKYWQLIVPRDRRTDFVKAAHEGATGGHFGRRRTADQVSRRAYWPGWRRTVDECCERCDICARVHKGRPPKYAGLQPLDVNGPMDRLHVDLCGPFAKSAGKEYILTCVDGFTRYLVAIPIPSKRAEVVAEAFVRHVISVHGCARQILTDLGREYINEIYETMLRMLHVTQLRTTSMKPSTNGRGERVHRTLHNMLAKLVADNQRDWSSVLPMCVFAYNVSRSEATGYSPYYLMHGREAICPLDLMCETPEQEGPAGIPEFVVQLQTRFTKAFQCVNETQKTRTERMKRSYDANVRNRPFTVGDFVYYYYPRTRPGHTAKWTRFYTGPFKILRAVNDVNYVISKSPKAKSIIVHADKLKLYQGKRPAAWTSLKDDQNLVADGESGNK